MTSVPTPTKPPAVTMTFTVTRNLPDNPSLAELDKIKTTAAEAKAALAKLGGVITGEVTIGRQKFNLENGAQ
jgi:hypothetical protein